jgi:serine/threonine protein kinase
MPQQQTALSRAMVMVRILYQLLHPEVRPLLQGGQDDNLSLSPTDDDNLTSLYEWSAATKKRKLDKVKDPLAQNLLWQLLSKDASQRPSLERVLAHPFMSNKHVVRMAGQ